MNRARNSRVRSFVRQVLILLLAAPLAALAELSCPSAPEAVSHDVKVSTEAQFAALGKLKGMELRNQTEVIANDVLARTPQADKVYVAQMLASMFCSLLRESKQLSDEDKLREFSRFQDRLQAMMLSGEKPAAKPKPEATKPTSAMPAREQLAKLGIPFTTHSLLIAVQNGDMVAVQLLLDAGMSPNAPDNCNFPLLSAVTQENVRMVEALLKAGADVNLPGNAAGCNAGIGVLSIAASKGRADLVNRLLAAGANRAQIGHAFVNAAARGQLSIVQQLRGKISEQKYLDSALSEAAGRGHVRMTEYLLNNGANLSQAKSSDGRTPLLLHVSQLGLSEVVSLLLTRGADVNQSGRFSNRPCAAVCLAVFGAEQSIRFEAASQQDWVKTVRILLRAGARVDEPFGPDKMPTTLYYVVTRNQSRDIATLLLDHGANVDAVDESGVSALMQVAGAGRRDWVEFLLVHGAKRDLRSRDGWTALDFAKSEKYSERHREIVKLLSGPESATSSINAIAAR